MRVGFIGLGAMGRPMATNVVKAGYPVTVYDTNRAAMEAMRAVGALTGTSSNELAESSDLVITMLPRPEDVEKVVLGPRGLADALPAGAVLVDMSTGDPLTAQRLAAALDERGVLAVDCPVGRTVEHAEAGTLLLLAGGHDEAVERARPVLMCMGDDLVRCGGPGMGQAMKLVNNMLAISVAQGVAEALALGLHAGLPLDVIRSVTSKTMAQTAMLDSALPAKAFAGDLTPGFALRLAEKDMELATRLAERLGVPVPVAERTQRRCADLIAAGHADQDIGVLVTAQAGLESGTEGKTES